MPKTLKHLQCFLLFVLTVTFYSGNSQTSSDYETISTTQGLSQGMIFDLLQDKEGFIWIATKNGLNRFDGYDFKVFTNDPYNATSLSGNTVLRLAEDKQGRIWVGTENEGLNIYNKKSGNFRRIKHDQQNSQSLPANAVKLMTEIPDGRMLVATGTAGFCIIDLGTNFFEPGSKPVITRLALPNNQQVYGMGVDGHGTIWIGGMDKTVYRFDPLKNNFTLLPGAELLNNGYFTEGKNILIGHQLFLSNRTQVIPLFNVGQTKPGNILFRPTQQLWENHHRELSFYEVASWNPGKPLAWDRQLPAETRLLYPFIIDRSGIVWSGSVGYGLRKYNTGTHKFKRVFLPGYSVRWVVPVPPADLFVGNYAYGWKRLTRGDQEDSAFANLQDLPKIDNFIVSRTGQFYIKSDIKGYFRYQPTTGELTSIPGIRYYYAEGDKQPMLEDNSGNIWFSGLGGKFAILNPQSNKIDSFSISTGTLRPLAPKSLCTALYQDKSGVFWIGTQQGFAKVNFDFQNPAKLKIQWFYNDSSNRNSLNYNHVSSFLDDPQMPEKYLWIGTKGGGLNRLDKVSGDYLHVTTADGLPDNVIYGILQDNQKNIWGSTNRGIFCIVKPIGASPVTWVFHSFTKENGLQDDEFNTGAYATLPNGNLAFGGVNGLNIFNPREMLAGDYTPNVYITDIQVNNKPVTVGDDTKVLHQTIEEASGITLNHLQDILTLEFASLDYTAPNQNKYRYQLVGIDNSWVNSGTRRSATYLHLPPGHFIFRVQGSNSQGTWSKNIAQLAITVLPPWWRTWWAYFAYALGIFLSIRAYFRFTVKKARLQSQLSFEQLEAKRIKELDAAKTRLYTNITHEFRTPLTIILGMAQQVQSNPSLYLQQGMDMILRNGRSLLNLVNEMLDLSKLESGTMQLQPVSGNVVTFLRYIIESFDSLAKSQQKQLHFLADIDSLQVQYDPEKLQQIFGNLLSNAIKFTPEKGNIYINVSQVVANNASLSTTLIIKVKDTGIGIPETELHHIFERFFQLDNSHTRKAEGTGIGLALTKELVKLMNGEISVQSPPPGSAIGTEFTVKIPLTITTLSKDDQVQVNRLAWQTTPAIAVTKETTTAQGAARQLILLVEDNADVVAYTATCLENYKLAVGKDGKEGFELAVDLVPDLIITDVMMPIVDGFELCGKLKHDERTSHIPVIMLTAKANFESRMEGLQQGADVYLEKPFNREELLVRIKKLLELRLKLQQYYSGILGLPAPATASGAEADKQTIIIHPAEDDFIKKVRQAIEDNISNPDLSVEQLCKLVYMSQSQLQRKLDALTGLSPNKFIRGLRLQKAMHLLQHSGLSIASIAQDCGYNDPGYFARIFKQENNMTPQDWRSNNKSVINNPSS